MFIRYFYLDILEEQVAFQVFSWFTVSKIEYTNTI